MACRGGSPGDVRHTTCMLTTQAASALPTWVQWVSALGGVVGPCLTFIGAAIAATVAYRAYQQRKEDDQRAEWWRRTQWALDYAADDDTGRGRIGLSALNYLSESELATDSDRDFMAEVLEDLIEVVVARDIESNMPEEPLYSRLLRSETWVSWVKAPLARVRRDQ
jgi:hypothetical protein